VVFAGPGNSKRKAAQQLEIARKYVSELNYDQAIIAYLDTIKIDPKNTDAYLELAELYVKTGQPQKALEILEEAKKKVEESDWDRVDKEIIELKQKINASVDPNGTQQVADNKDAADKGGSDKNDNTNTNGDGNTPDTSEGTEPGNNRETENGNSVENSEFQGNTEEPAVIEEDNGPAPDILPMIERNPYSVKEYNATGQLVKTEYTDPQTGEYTYYVREYDSNGKCIRGTMHMVINTLVNGVSGQVDIKDYVDDYDGNESIVKKTYLNADEGINNYITYEYDALGNCIKETWFNSDGSVSDYRVYEYDSDGKCIKYTYYWNGKPNDSYEYDHEICFIM
jgi:tetratricopeptide (TPR) repeat protein